ncbi:DUF805 domain-containing protein [Burkholderia sp. MR1-5-21]
MNLKWFLFFFNGRIGRLEWWIYTVITGVISLLVDAMTRDAGDDAPIWLVLSVLAIAVLAVWTCLAVGVKRLHDIDKSGWWLLLYLVPIVGPIALLVMHGFLAGTPHANRFGEPLKKGDDASSAEGDRA